MTSFFYFRQAYQYKENETGRQYNGRQRNSTTWRALDSSG
jgi:hypothetical protein